MRRKGKSSDGFFLCFLFNLLFNYWLGLIALVLLILHFWLKIPLFLTFIGLLAWVGVALITSVMVLWAAKTSDEETPYRENLNPYSAKNSDVFGVKRAPGPEKEVEEIYDQYGNKKAPPKENA